MLLILTFGAIVNSLRFYLRAWGKEPFISPLSAGDAVMHSSSAHLFSAWFQSCVRKCLCCNVVHKAAHSYRNFPFCSAQFWNLLSSIGQSCL